MRNLPKNTKKIVSNFIKAVGVEVLYGLVVQNQLML